MVEQTINVGLLGRLFTSDPLSSPQIDRQASAEVHRFPVGTEVSSMVVDRLLE